MLMRALAPELTSRFGVAVRNAGGNGGAAVPKATLDRHLAANARSLGETCGAANHPLRSSALSNRKPFVGYLQRQSPAGLVLSGPHSARWLEVLR